ncbi:class Ib ribonucleoside-diphosphate reductase assembly flavoprotein NrdI [Bacillus sp. 28A-2]|uniref:class Ib ribonucleoside-diphosphate reductase assembly flavoprotein NrdI n=1 Tax=Bacillus sp. 28A-2 TaxID=2772252 RepID=UPI00168D2C1E|nr:class Ib ribonucleoside-diphosphate reductase assembly flavoprotein NrdI [Bacillus sp. 28A-2]MBD3861391.1 class Ib ribonucleoside-diphosphate reductase assembly flavoprotein NrdI [Bacillus sp. 28A-2]
MIVYFYSLTGNVRRFIAKTGLGGQAREIKTSEVVEEPFVLVTPTYDFGQPPATVSEWLKDNGDLMVSVAASGNRAWGDGFGAAADVIATLYGVPVVGKFELAGTEEDVRLFTERVTALG